MSNRRNHTDYTLAWVCPLEIEQTAAIKMLDESHEPLEQERTDYNTYTLGRIGRHNIVIVALHQAGNSSATSVVTQIRNTFSDIRSVLLVGIGGGVPVKTSSGIIRLGDVVVSKPVGEYPGVVQYDHGKAEIGVFKRTGALQPPPAVLLRAAQDLAVNRTLTDEAMDPLTTSLSRITSDKRLKAFHFPGRQMDFLFESDYAHLCAGYLCSDSNCDPAKRIQHDYVVDEAHVQVHRGVIASGELVIKDAKKRDELAAQHGVLCFETEAAGVLADTPCLVIRGISDYCDSHKNDQWYGYAAATAAAYARELVLRLPMYKSKQSNSPTSDTVVIQPEPESWARLSLLMESLQRFTTTGVQKPIEEQRRHLLTWVTPVFPDTEYHTALSLRLQGTCSWILHRTQFHQWLETTEHNESKILWIRGGPGCGKTILSASIIQHLSSEVGVTSPVAYFFCTSEDERKCDPNSIPRSWLAQLLNRYDDAVKIALSLYEPNKYRIATAAEVWEALRRICHKFRQCTFLVDGLDECEPLQQQQPWFSAKERFLEELWQFAAASPVRILISSRRDAEIFSNIRSTSRDRVTLFEYDIWPEDTSNDIVAFCQKVVRNRLEVNKDQGLIEDICKEAASRGSGMFLWVRLLGLQLDPGKNKSQLREAVHRMPKGLEQTYRREIEFIMRLDDEEKARAMSILRWILFARRPLTVRELTEAVLSEQSSTSYPYSDLPDNWDEYYVNGVIRKLCRSLVDVRGNAFESSIEAHTVHLMHASVKEFLTKHVTASADGAISFAEACREHEVLARTCLSYLCYEEVLPHALSLANDLDDRLGRFPFIRYASREWSAHIATSGNISDSVGALIRKLLDPTASRWAAWSKVILSSATSSMKAEPSHQSIPVSPIYWASYLGLREIVLWLLSCDVDVNASDEIYGSALQAAASRGNTETLQLLIANGADANIPCTKYVYAIIRAVDQCPPKKIKEVIGLLLDAGADITSCDRDGRTALHYATLSGSIETVAFLIQHGAAVDVSDKDGSTALVLAAAHGHTELAKLLVAKGANTETVNNKRQTPLLLAAGMNFLEILNFLLQNGARVNSKTSDEAFTPLHLAAAKGHIDAVQALILHGALVNMRSAGQPPLTPLSAAAYFGHCPIIQFLVCHGASVTDFDSEDFSPLMFAVAGKCYPAVQCLLEEGAPVSTTLHGGYTPLHIAACADRIDIIQLLLQHGAQVNAAATRGATPLQVAIDFGNALAVSCLIEHNAAFELSGNGNNPSPLMSAIRQGSKEIVQLLLQLGANPDTIDPEQSSPLAAAVAWGYSEIVQLLLEHGARADAETEGDSMLMLIAIKLGHTDVIRVLLGNGPDLDLDPSISLACAIKYSRLDIVRLLIGLEPYKGLARDPIYVAVAASLECDGITQLLIHHSMEVDMID